jgi:hypothetical protein
MYKAGIDLFEYEEGYIEALTLSLRAYYGATGEEWISWFIYERVGITGEVKRAWDKQNNAICFDIPSLWKHVEEIRVSIDFTEYELPQRDGSDKAAEVFLSLFRRLSRGQS